MYFQQITTPGLGCFSYAIGCPNAGVMMVVDPRRDTDVYHKVADENGMRITHVFDTHVHADHVSGARQLRAETEVDIYIHENAPVAFEAKKLKNGDEFTLGSVNVRILHTPGHTPDSISLLISDLSRSREPEMVLTGDLLFVGDVGRPDLPGSDVLDEQVKNLYDSLYRVLGELPDYLEVFPGHGQGSLCGQGMGAKPNSTLGYERRANPMLLHNSFESFKKALMSSLPMRPMSFSGIIRSNTHKVAIISRQESQSKYELTPENVEELCKTGSAVLDLRDALSYSAAHIKGSIHVDAKNASMLNWIGAAIPPDTPLILILPPDRSFAQMRLELQRIGYDLVKGWLAGGLVSWLGEGYMTQSTPHISVAGLSVRLLEKKPLTLIDVRNPNEYANSKIEGAINLPLSRIFANDVPECDTSQESVVICKSGFRASLGASLLEAKGYGGLNILSGGMDAWIKKGGKTC